MKIDGERLAYIDFLNETAMGFNPAYYMTFMEKKGVTEAEIKAWVTSRFFRKKRMENSCELCGKKTGLRNLKLCHTCRYLYCEDCKSPDGTEHLCMDCKSAVPAEA